MTYCIRLFLVVFFPILVIQCKSQSKALPFNCESVRYLIERYQRFRIKHRRILSPANYFLDSLLVDGGIAKGLDGLSEIDSETRKKYIEQAQILETMNPPPKSTLDSIWALQTKLDYENTELLISMILSQDKAVFDTLPYKCGREAFIVFVHTPDELKEKVKNTIDFINLKGIDEAQYNHIMRRIEDRN